MTALKRPRLDLDRERDPRRRDRHAVDITAAADTRASDAAATPPPRGPRARAAPRPPTAPDTAAGGQAPPTASVDEQADRDQRQRCRDRPGAGARGDRRRACTPPALPRRSPPRGAGAGTAGGGGTRSVAWSHAGSRRGHGLNQAGPQTELLVCDHRSGGTSAGAPSVLSIRLALPPPEADPIRPKERDVTRRPPATLTGAMARQPAGASSTRSEMPINPAKATRPVSASRVPNAYISGAARALQQSLRFEVCPAYEAFPGTPGDATRMRGRQMRRFRA